MDRGDELYGITYERGETLFQQGEPGDTMYIVQSGAVEVSQSRKGKDVVLSILEQGDFVGEMTLVDQAPRSATVTALCRSRLLPLTRASLMTRVEKDPGVALHLLKALSTRIEQTNRLLRERLDSDETLLSSLQRLRPKGAPRDSSLAETHPASPQSWKPDLKTEDLARLRTLFDRQTGKWYETGEIVFRRDDPGDTLWIIAEGLIEITHDGEKGNYVMARLGAYDIFGEMAIFSGQPRSATAAAYQRTRVLPIRREEFLDRIRMEPEIALFLLQIMILRLRRTLAALENPEHSMEVLLHNLPPALKKEDRITMSFVSLSACSGCIMGLLDEPEVLSSLLKQVEIVYTPMLMDEEEIKYADIAVVDGAVRTEEEKEKLRQVRNRSRYLIAWGTCAAFGGVPAMANRYELEELIEESYGQAQDPFSYYLSGSPGVDTSTYSGNELAMLRKAGKVDDFVKVDYYLSGCPPRISLLNQLIAELTGTRQVLKPRKVVCSECDREPLRCPVTFVGVYPSNRTDPGDCFNSQGTVCMGFLTKGGCNGVCPRGGLPCWGCRGPSEYSLKQMQDGVSFEQLLVKSLMRRCGLAYDDIAPVAKILGKRGNSLLKFDHYFVHDRSRLR